MTTPDPNESNEPAELRPVNPYEPPEAKLEGQKSDALDVIGQVLQALLKILAVGFSALIAFGATCAVTLSISDRLPLYLISPVVGLAVLFGMSYNLIFGRPRTRR